MSLATVDLNLPRSGLVQHMPGAVWHPVEGAGHFVAVGSADDVFAIAAEELGA
jgi:acetaldehyde dehydrogenase (acetylating)